MQHPPVLLVLDNGTKLRPQGTTWEAFWNSTTPQPNQRVLIDFNASPTLAIYTWHNAEITCVSLAKNSL
jgi:hypothetical protein